jgi:hypothetical protein
MRNFLKRDRPGPVASFFSSMRGKKVSKSGSQASKEPVEGLKMLYITIVYAECYRRTTLGQ